MDPGKFSRFGSLCNAPTVTCGQLGPLKLVTE
jgi:hypothetical protein